MIPCSKDPEWNQFMEMKVRGGRGDSASKFLNPDAPFTRLRIQVYDRDWFSTDVIGEVVIQLSVLMDGRKHRFTRPLKTSAGREIIDHIIVSFKVLSNLSCRCHPESVLTATSTAMASVRTQLANRAVAFELVLDEDPMSIKLRPPPGHFYARAAAWEAPIEAVVHSCPPSTANSQMSKGLNCPWNIMMKGCLNGDIRDSTNVSAISAVSDSGLGSLKPSLSHHVCQTASSDLGAFQVTSTSTILQQQLGDNKVCSVLQSKNCLNQCAETGLFFQISPTAKMTSCCAGVIVRNAVQTKNETDRLPKPIDLESQETTSTGCSNVNTGKCFSEASQHAARADEKNCLQGQSPDSAQVLASTPSGKQQDLARKEMEEILILLRQGLSAGLELDDGQVVLVGAQRVLASITLALRYAS